MDGNAQSVPLLPMCILLTSVVPAYAVRPFITDDTRVVGCGQAQMEASVRGDRAAFLHWALVSYGPGEPLD